MQAHFKPRAATHAPGWLYLIRLCRRCARWLAALPLALSALLAVCASLALSAPPAAAAAISLLDASDDAPLGLHADVLQEFDRPLSLDAARAAWKDRQFRPGAQPVVNLGIGARPVWLRIAVSNPGSEAGWRRLQIENAWLDDVAVHFVDQDGRVSHARTGDRRPFADRPLARRFFAFDHAFAPGTTEIYIRAESPDPLVLPVFLLTDQQADARDRQQAFSYGIVYGFLIALLAYNAVLFSSLGDRRYLLYSCFLGVFLALNTAYTGHAYAWFWPDSPALQQWIIPLLMMACGVIGLRFATCFLQTRERTPRAHRLIGRFIGSALIAFALAALAGKDQAPALVIAFAFITLFSAAMIALGIAAWRAGVASSGYFLTASVASMVGTASTALTVWGFVPYTDAGFRAAEFGMLIDATLLALALGARFRFVQLEKVLSELSRDELADNNQKLSETLREVERLASTDRLTGLWNRLHVERVAAAEMERATRYRHSTSLLLFDIDHFKRVNDRFGHRAGDETLVGLASVMRRRLRDSDLAARWGGEEFLVLMPNTGLADATLAADKLRRQVAAELATPDGQPVTISIGVAEWRGDGESLDAWIVRADRVLYLAKENGRNRVETDLSEDGSPLGEQRPLLQLIWSATYESGVPQIDREHRALVESANRVLALLPALTSPDTADAARIAALDATELLVREVRRHFAAEEGLLDGWGWPDLDVHRAEHARLLERARELCAALRQGEPGIAGAMLIDFLAREVVAGHILVHDRAYFPFVAAGGEPQPSAVTP